MEQNQEEKKVVIPESITLNGVTYVVKDTPELLGLVTAVSKVEKTKLYTQMENVRKQVESLKDVQIEPQSFNMEELVQKLGGVFVTKADLTETLKEVVQPVLSATEKSRLEDLEAYRNAAINNNLATCIPELVKGDTKEEIDRTLQESIALRAKYPSANTVNVQPDRKVEDPLIKKQQEEMANAAKQTPTPEAIPQPTPPIRVPGIPAADASATPTQGAKKMTPEEFAKNRDVLKQQIEGMYGSN